MMVDKYAVKDYVTKKIGSQYVVPTLGVWKHFDEIDFVNLPEQFVLKCTHDSGSIAICKNQAEFDKKAAKSTLGKHRISVQMSKFIYQQKSVDKFH